MQHVLHVREHSGSDDLAVTDCGVNVEQISEVITTYFSLGLGLRLVN